MKADDFLDQVKATRYAGYLTRPFNELSVKARNKNPPAGRWKKETYRAGNHFAKIDGVQDTKFKKE